MSKFREITLPWLTTVILVVVFAACWIEFFRSAMYEGLSERMQAVLAIAVLAVLFPAGILVAMVVSSFIISLAVKNYVGDMFVRSTELQGVLAGSVHLATRLGKFIRRAAGPG